MSNDIRHSGEVGGSVFLFLFILFIAYCWFLHDGIGEFKTCNQDKYPHQTFCIKEKR